MSAEIKEKAGLQADLVPGGGGVFEVEADAKLIFSKRQAKRFPEVGEIAAALGFDSEHGITE